MSTKSSDLLIKDKNYSELSNSTFANTFNRNSFHMIKSKINNENNKLLGTYIKNSFEKKNIKNIRKMIHNYNEGNIRKYNNNSVTKKIGLVSIPIKQTKLTLLEKNKNITLLKAQGKNRNNENKDNKFLFHEKKENQIEKIVINSKANNKNSNSKEKKYKHISYSQKNTKKDMINKVINTIKK